MGKRVDRIKTDVSESQMAKAIIECWKKIFGEEPFKEQISMVLAQNALETGHRKSMYNYNVGNITTNGKGSFDFYDDLQTSEQTSPGVWEKKNLKYRAYPSLNDGVYDYLKFLSGSPRYANAWQHILNPNPAEFSKALKKGGYYTANEAPYTKYLTSLYDKFNKSDSVKAQSKPTELAAKPSSDKSTNDIESVITSFLGMVTATEKSNKKIYKKFLPQNNVNIEVQSSDIVSSIEFGRILSSVLDEELLSKSSTYIDGDNVMVICSIAGPSNDCLKVIHELSKSVTDAFKLATIKIGGIDIKTQCSINKTSSYNEISIDLAHINYRKFLLKFL